MVFHLCRPGGVPPANSHAKTRGTALGGGAKKKQQDKAVANQANATASGGKVPSSQVSAWVGQVKHLYPQSLKAPVCPGSEEDCYRSLAPPPPPVTSSPSEAGLVSELRPALSTGRGLTSLVRGEDSLPGPPGFSSTASTCLDSTRVPSSLWTGTGTRSCTRARPGPSPGAGS